MKKLFSMYKKYMFHPILYKCVTRVSIVAVLMLLWDRYVSDGTFTMWQAPALLLGAILLGWAWVDYLRLDGVTIHHLAEEFKDMGKKKKRHVHYFTKRSTLHLVRSGIRPRAEPPRR